MMMAEVPTETVELTEVRDSRILRKKRSLMESVSEVNLHDKCIEIFSLKQSHDIIMKKCRSTKCHVRCYNQSRQP